MKAKLILFLLICLDLSAQKQKIHLFLAADIEDSKYGVKALAKEEKVTSIFNLVKKEIGFDLTTVRLHKSEFNAQEVLNKLSSIKVIGKDDIIVFYYIGRGFYKNPIDKFPLLEFRNTKKMLSYEQIRSKVKTKGARLALIIADCDESYTIANTETLPYSLLQTGYNANPSNAFEKALADISNNFSMIEPTEKIDQANTNKILGNKFFDKRQAPIIDSAYYKNTLATLLQLRDKPGQNYSGTYYIKVSNQYYVLYNYNYYGFPESRHLAKDWAKLPKIKPGRFRGYSISQDVQKLVIDSLYNKQRLLDDTDPLNVYLDSIIAYNNRELDYKFDLSPEDLNYYEFALDSIVKLNDNFKENASIIEAEKANLIESTLKNYLRDGFIKHVDNYKKVYWASLPKIRKVKSKQVDYEVYGLSYIVDSLYLKKAIFNPNDPLNLYLDSLIEYRLRPVTTHDMLNSKSENEYYYKTISSLQTAKWKLGIELEPSIETEKNNLKAEIVKNYSLDGFPKGSLKEQWAKLPKVVVGEYKTALIPFEFIKLIVDSLYRKKTVSVLIDSLDKQLYSILEYNRRPFDYTKQLSTKDSLYFQNTLMSLSMLFKAKNSNMLSDLSLKRLSMAYDIILSYQKEGFPQNNLYPKKEIWSKLPIIKKSKYRIHDVGYDQIKLIVDSCYLKGTVLDATDTLNQYLENLLEYTDRIKITPELSDFKDENIAYFLETYEKLSSLSSKLTPQKSWTKYEKRTYAQLFRLEKYQMEGLPTSKSAIIHTRWKTLPKIFKVNYKIHDFKPEDLDIVIDSIFNKKRVLNSTDHINLYLDSLIEYMERPLILPIELLQPKERSQYYSIADSLEITLNKDPKTEQDLLLRLRAKQMLSRLSDYVVNGFPEKNTKYKNAISKIPTGKQNEDIANVIDSLYKINSILAFKMPLQKFLDSLIDYSVSVPIKNLTRNDLEYYNKALNSLKIQMDTLAKSENFENNTLFKRVQIVHNDLLRYRKSGFPDPNHQYKKEIQELETKQIFLGPGSRQVFDHDRKYISITDSLYKRRAQFLLRDSLLVFLDYLIRYNLPMVVNVQASMGGTNNYAKPSLMKIFLTQCGVIEIANGHKKNLPTSKYLADYTDFIFKGLNRNINAQYIKDIEYLTLKSVFRPMDKEHIFGYNYPVPLNCSVVSKNLSFSLPNFTQVPSHSDISMLFSNFLETTDPAYKNKLKTQIINNFERDATILVKNVSGNQNSLAARVPKRYTITDYVSKLALETTKLNSLTIPLSSLVRNQNFSKIKNIMIVEK